jgi:hypothetical protein
MRKAGAWLTLLLSLLWTPFPLFAGFGGTDLVLPAVGQVNGLGGSHFYTTVWITNPSASEAADVQISFLRPGQANPNPQTYTETIAAGVTKVYENATESLFGAAGVLGAARVRSTKTVLVSSRIYNQNDGQTVAQSQGLFSSGVPDFCRASATRLTFATTFSSSRRRARTSLSI